jgi:hypothetical protein
MECLVGLSFPTQAPKRRTISLSQMIELHNIGADEYRSTVEGENRP